MGKSQITASVVVVGVDSAGLCWMSLTETCLLELVTHCRSSYLVRCFNGKHANNICFFLCFSLSGERVMFI